MAKNEKSDGGGGVVSLSLCAVEKCGKKSDKMNFCSEHYGWFKEGLISKKGQRPSDFDKKYQAYLHRKDKPAA